MTILAQEELVPYDDEAGDPQDIHANLNWHKTEEHPDLETIRHLIDQGLSDEDIISQMRRAQMPDHEWDEYHPADIFPPDDGPTDPETEDLIRRYEEEEDSKHELGEPKF